MSYAEIYKAAEVLPKAQRNEKLSRVLADSSSLEYSEGVLSKSGIVYGYYPCENRSRSGLFRWNVKSTEEMFVLSARVFSWGTLYRGDPHGEIYLFVLTRSEMWEMLQKFGLTKKHGRPIADLEKTSKTLKCRITAAYADECWKTLCGYRKSPQDI